MLTLTINSAASLRNIAQGLDLLKEKIRTNKSKINPGTDGAEDLQIYYQEKANEVEKDLIALNFLIDKNYKTPHFFCQRNEFGKDSICTQQCSLCTQNTI